MENGEAGHGFTNEAYRGNLKITKDSSDGRKDGFAIEVKSADGSFHAESADAEAYCQDRYLYYRG